MEAKEAKGLSKFLSFILRHKPETIGITLDKGGWANIDELIEKSRSDMHPGFDREKLEFIVSHNNKQRFSFSEDGRKIRANQGHSIPVDLGLMPKEPPHSLFHGTADKNVASIMAGGLQRQSRHHVHLSADKATAKAVGMRYGKPVILTIHSRRMHEEGHVFFQSENGVWLTLEVPVSYIDFN
ncbi:RNA 2'-phosphotransferase [Roseivirga sp. BDSF3-8]|uniref:RNA 2'-phosphotransferase n=1 Tax=Roseivirga sp. BDSF3-8 TaxID=3241598 RepID=UPI0035319224